MSERCKATVGLTNGRYQCVLQDGHFGQHRGYYRCEHQQQSLSPCSTCHNGDQPIRLPLTMPEALKRLDTAAHLITRLTEALAEAIRCAGHVHTHDCPMRNYNTPCKCWVLPARAALAAVAKERAG